MGSEDDRAGARELRGRCHCGNISLVLEIPRDAAPIPVRICGCDFCRKHGGAYTSHPGGRLAVRVADGRALSRYRFGTGTADFLVCARCGVVPAVVDAEDEQPIAVVNVNCLEGLSDSDVTRAPADFEGESVEARRGRRRRSWIPTVSVHVEDA